MSKDTLIICLTICICSLSGFLYFKPFESHNSTPLSWIIYWGAILLVLLLNVMYKERKK